MPYSINVQQDAKNDIAEATNWLDEQRLGLGLQLIQRIDESINQILLQPLGYQKVFLAYRKISTKQFSYSIYYDVNIETEEINIVAVLHTSRNPITSKKRMKSS